MGRCEWCGDQLPDDSRLDRRFCTDSHRAQASQARRRLATDQDFARFAAFFAEVGTADQIAAWNALTDPQDLENLNA